MAESAKVAEEPTPLTEADLKSKTTIYVKNSEFPADYTEEKLSELFADCGTVVKSTLLRKPATNELRGTGFVEFETNEAAAKAVKEYNNKLVGNGRLGVVYSTSSGPKEPKPQKEVAEGPTLFVRSLDYKVRSKQLKEKFGDFGKIKQCRVNKKGYAFIQFDSVETAKKAKEEMNGKELEGKAIEIFFAEQREKETKSDQKKGEEKAEQTPEKKSNKRKRNNRGKKRGGKQNKKEQAKEEEPKEEKKEKKENTRKPRGGRRRIFLKCMPEEGGEKTSDNVTDEDVKGFLAQYGEVTKCKVIQKAEGTFVYANFKEPDDAAKAKAAGEGDIKGSNFSIQYAPNNKRGPGRRRAAGAAGAQTKV